MPLPRPQVTEDKSQFVSRCLSHPDVKDKFGESTKQANAVCNNIWNERDQETLSLIEQRIEQILDVEDPDEIKI